MCIRYYIFEEKKKKLPQGSPLLRQDATLEEKNKNKQKKKTPTALSKRANKEGDWELRRPTGWYEVLTLHAEVHERKRSSSKTPHRERLCLMPAIQERRAELAAISPPKWEIPWSDTVQSWGTTRQKESPFNFGLDFWVVHLYIYIFSPRPLHMHTFTVQGCSVCNQRLCFFCCCFFFSLRLKSSRSNVPQQGSTASYNAREPLLQSVVSHCRFLQTWDVFWWTFSNKKISSSKIKHEKNPKKTKLKARDGKRSAMYRLNCPVKTKTTVV